MGNTTAKYLVCFISLLLISFSISLRIEPSLLQQDYLSAFSISIADINDAMTSYQNWLMVALLIAGITVDKVSALKVLLGSALIASLGNIFFSHGPTGGFIYVGRLLLSFAHPFILISALKLGTEFIPRKWVPLFFGLAFASLLLTPQLNNIVIPHLEEQTSTLAVYNMFSMAGIIMSVILIGLYRRLQHHATVTPWKIWGNYQIWLLVVISFIGWLPNTFLLNWGTFFLAHVTVVPLSTAYQTMTNTFTCFAIGAVIASLLTLRFTIPRILGAGYAAAALTFLLFVVLSHFALDSSVFFLMATGFFSAVTILCYYQAYASSDLGLSGTAMGLVAMFTTAGNTLFSWMAKMITTGMYQQNPSLTDWAWNWLVIAVFLGIGSILALQLRSEKPEA